MFLFYVSRINLIGGSKDKRGVGRPHENVEWW